MPTPIRRILHLDMDAFYASVEQRDDPSLRGRPVVVGGSPKGRGVVAAASYEARRYGIRSAMSAAQALRRCPELVFVKPDFRKYRQVSTQVRAMLHDMTPLVEPLSLDEAYLDVTELPDGFDTARAVAEHLRARIREELQLTASAGVSHLKFVAKIASAYRKPDGLTVVPPQKLRDFLDPLPVRKVWGVGPATEQRLKGLGIATIADLAAADPDALGRALGKHGPFLWRLANGDDPREVRPHRERKSRSTERTFAEDLDTLEAMHDVLALQAEELGRDLRRADQRARRVTLKARYADFTTVTRATTLDAPTDDEQVLREAAEALLERTDAAHRPVRLLGLGVSGFGDELTAGPTVDPRQLDLPLPRSEEGSSDG